MPPCATATAWLHHCRWPIVMVLAVLCGLFYAHGLRALAVAVVTLPVFYRGIWIDEFILLGLPALAWMWIGALRRGHLLLALLLSIGFFNLLFYPLVSLNIPRYQMTAVPVIALAVGVLVARLHRRSADVPSGEFRSHVQYS